MSQGVSEFFPAPIFPWGPHPVPPGDREIPDPRPSPLPGLADQTLSDGPAAKAAVARLPQSDLFAGAST
eukprot:5510497-Pyramimonas_sp.AAC.1